MALYTQQASPYTQRRNQVYSRPTGRPAGATAPLTRGAVTPPTTGTPAPQTPTGSGVSPNMQQSAYAPFLQQLTQPIEYQSQQQERYGLAQEQIQRGTRLEAEQMRRYMGGRGFRGGESGIADTALGGVFRGGAERLSQASRAISQDEAAREAQYAQMNLQRMLGAGQLGLGGEELTLAGQEGAMNRMMQMWQSMIQSQQGRFQPYWQTQAQGY